MDSTIGVVVFLAFIVTNIVLYGFAAAIQAMNESEVEKLAQEGDTKAAKILKFMKDPAKLVTTIQVAAVTINIIMGAFVLRAFEKMTVRSNWVTLGISALMIIIITVAGILVPKKLASVNPKKWVYSLFGIISFILWVTTPVTAVITVIAKVVIRMFGIDPDADTDNVTEEEIIDIVNEGHEQGVIEENEAVMINNIIEFGDKEAKDIMTHRKSIEAIDAESTLEDTVHWLLRQNYSRFPVYSGDIDNIIGILHIKDALMEYERSSNRNKTIQELNHMLLKAHFIPETRNINSLFTLMQSDKIHMTIVVDEYGQTSGIVTMEDILEEIVGNILDEFDDDEELITKQEDDTYIIDGLTLLEDLEDELGIEFDEEDYDTINGFIISKLGRLPEDQEQFETEYKGYVFKVLEANRKMIQKVSVTKLQVAQNE